MALKDFQNYVASQGGGGAEQYVDPTTGKIKTEKTGGAISKTPTTSAKDTGFDFGAANNLGTALQPMNIINPALSITGNNGDSAWQQGKDAISKDVATATGKDYIPYVEQVQNKVNNPVTPTPPTEPPINVAPTPTPTPTVTTPTVNTTPTPAPTPTPPTNVVGGQAGSGNAPTPITWAAPTLSGATDMSDYINEMYAKQRDSQLAALESGYNQQMAALDAAAGNIPQQYYEAGRQQAGQNALDTKAMNERLMASGLNTGAAGQAALAQNAVNQGNMARIRQAEADALAEVEQQRASTSVAYQDAIKEAILNNDTQKALALYQEAQRVDESMVNTALKQAELDRMEYEYRLEADKMAQERADKKAAQELAALEQRAATMASIGDFSLYEYLGYTPEQITALGNAYAAANTKSSGGGHSAPEQNKSNMTLSTAKQLAENGYFSDEVLSVLGQNGYDAGALYTMYGYSAPVSAPENIGTEAQNVINAINRGDDSATASLMEYYLKSGRITDTEAAYLFALAGV